MLASGMADLPDGPTTEAQALSFPALHGQSGPDHGPTGSGASSAQDQPVAANFVRSKPLQKRHAEEVLAKHAGPGHESAHPSLRDRTHPERVQRHGSSQGSA